MGGSNGLRVVEVDVAGQELRDLETPIDPVSGNNIELTIDTRLQALSKNIVKKELNGWNAWLGSEEMSSAVAIAMNPKTGEILSMVSYPTYENNRFARVIPAYYYEQLTRDLKKPLLNHAISAEHPPGSVYKLAPWIGVMNEGMCAATKRHCFARKLERSRSHKNLHPMIPARRVIMCAGRIMGTVWWMQYMQSPIRVMYGSTRLAVVFKVKYLKDWGYG